MKPARVAVPACAEASEDRPFRLLEELNGFLVKVKSEKAKGKSVSIKNL